VLIKSCAYQNAGRSWYTVSRAAVPHPLSSLSTRQTVSKNVSVSRRGAPYSLPTHPASGGSPRDDRLIVRTAAQRPLRAGRLRSASRIFTRPNRSPAESTQIPGLLLCLGGRGDRATRPGRGQAGPDPGASSGARQRPAAVPRVKPPGADGPRQSARGSRPSGAQPGAHGSSTRSCTPYGPLPASTPTPRPNSTPSARCNGQMPRSAKNFLHLY